MKRSILLKDTRPAQETKIVSHRQIHYGWTGGKAGGGDCVTELKKINLGCHNEENLRKHLCKLSCFENVYFLGWLVVWKMFLIRFSFIRELFYGSSNGNSHQTKERIMPTPLRRSSRIRDMKSRK